MRKQARAGGSGETVLFNGVVGQACCLAKRGVGERSLNDSTHSTDRACAGHRQGIGHEHSEDVVLAGGAEGREKKSKVGLSDVTTPPPPPVV